MQIRLNALFDLYYEICVQTVILTIGQRMKLRLKVYEQSSGCGVNRSFKKAKPVLQYDPCI